MNKILWIEDELDRNEELLKDLRKNDYKVKFISHVKDAKKEIEYLSSYDYVLLDLMMKRGEVKVIKLSREETKKLLEDNQNSKKEIATEFYYYVDLKNDESLTGHALFRLIREKNRKIPIIILSNNNNLTKQIENDIYSNKFSKSIAWNQLIEELKNLITN